MIVGKTFAKSSMPRRIIFDRQQKKAAILHLEVYDSSMPMEITYMEPIIIEKISTYFGYKAVERIIDFVICRCSIFPTASDLHASVNDF